MQIKGFLIFAVIFNEGISPVQMDEVSRVACLFNSIQKARILFQNTEARCKPI